MHRNPAFRLILYPIYLALSLFVMVALFEVGLRVLGYASSDDAPASVPELYDKFKADKDLIWALKEDWQGLEFNKAPVRTNSLGLRGPEPREGGGHDIRIYFLGDSVVYGHYLREDMTIPALVGRALSGATGRTVDVINGGVPGYSTFQEAGQFERNLKALGPDVALLGFCLNDITERYFTLKSFGGRRFLMFNVDSTAGMGAIERLLTRSAVRNFIVERVRKKSGMAELYRIDALWEEPESPHIKEAMETVYRELDGLVERAARENVRLAVVLFPYSVQLRDPARTSAPQRLVRDRLEKSGVPVLDLLDFMGPEHERLFMDYSHFTPEGSAMVSGVVAGFVMNDVLK
jgi:hypothetical protein